QPTPRLPSPRRGKSGVGPMTASITDDLAAAYAARHEGQLKRLWRPVLGWEHYYEVSDDGLVRRFEYHFIGGSGAQCTVPAGPVRQWVATNDYLNVTFQRNGIIRTAGVHVLIAE